MVVCPTSVNQSLVCIAFLHIGIGGSRALWALNSARRLPSEDMSRDRLRLNPPLLPNHPPPLLEFIVSRFPEADHPLLSDILVDENFLEALVDVEHQGQMSGICTFLFKGGEESGAAGKEIRCKKSEAGSHSRIKRSRSRYGGKDYQPRSRCEGSESDNTSRSSGSIGNTMSTSGYSSNGNNNNYRNNNWKPAKKKAPTKKGKKRAAASKDSANTTNISSKKPAKNKPTVSKGKK